MNDDSAFKIYDCVADDKIMLCSRNLRLFKEESKCYIVHKLNKIAITHRSRYATDQIWCIMCFYIFKPKFGRTAGVIKRGKSLHRKML